MTTLEYGNCKAFISKIPYKGSYIYYINTEPEFRGQGIGDKVLDMTLKITDRPVFVYAPSDQAIEWLNKKGFRMCISIDSEIPYSYNMILEE